MKRLCLALLLLAPLLAGCGTVELLSGLKEGFEPKTTEETETKE